MNEQHTKMGSNPSSRNVAVKGINAQLNTQNSLNNNMKSR